MALFHHPQIVTSGLVFAYDSANRKSYQGPPIQNRMTSVTPSAHGSGTGYNFIVGSEVSDIPSVGPTLVQYSNIQNTGASWCCPSPFAYMNGGTVSVSGSTLYTYAIVYRVESGYTNGNYMYRYEYNSGSSYLTEGGVHSDSNRVHLGNGWYWAWGTFTTQPTASFLNVYSFYYRYSSSYDKMSVANVLLVAGDYTGLHPIYWPSVSTTRATTAAIVDLTNKNTITASSLTYASNGTISFNGSSNTMDCGNSSSISVISGTSNVTVEAWVNLSGYGSSSYGVITHKGYPWAWLMENPSNTMRIRFYLSNSGDVACPDSATHALNTWYHFVGTYDGSNMRFYRNGTLTNTVAGSGTLGGSGANMVIGSYSGAYYSQGQIPVVKVYNRTLSAVEIQQNFNALRGRYGI
jgi:hypothetical protein